MLTLAFALLSFLVLFAGALGLLVLGTRAWRQLRPPTPSAWEPGCPFPRGAFELHNFVPDPPEVRLLHNFPPSPRHGDQVPNVGKFRPLHNFYRGS